MFSRHRVASAFGMISLKNSNYMSALVDLLAMAPDVNVIKLLTQMFYREIQYVCHISLDVH